MLYLFGSGSWKNNRKIVKIGYTGNIEERKLQYRLHNPLGEIIDTREGDKTLELKMHLRLIDHKVEFLDEWFYDEETVFEVFKQDEDIIDKWLWDRRGDTLMYPNIPLPGTMKRDILDELRRKFNTPIEGAKLL